MPSLHDILTWALALLALFILVPFAFLVLWLLFWVFFYALVAVIRAVLFVLRNWLDLPRK